MLPWPVWIPPARWVKRHISCPTMFSSTCLRCRHAADRRSDYEHHVNAFADQHGQCYGQRHAGELHASVTCALGSSRGPPQQAATGSFGMKIAETTAAGPDGCVHHSPSCANMLLCVESCLLHQFSAILIGKSSLCPPDHLASPCRPLTPRLPALQPLRRAVWRSASLAT